MEHIIKSRKYKSDVSFFRSANGSYVYVTLPPGAPGYRNRDLAPLGQQICHGGGLQGSTITYIGQRQSEFANICTNWWKQYLKYYA